MKILWCKCFKRSYQKVIQKSPQLKSKVTDGLKILANNPFTPSIKSHKLTGNLKGFWSFSVAYDCRIIFSFSEDGELLEMIILLIDIGIHDDIY
ncbi:type II toxin-antitoxin system YafQ family toxin [Geminocystis sp. GBBB08]|uniref:type II toxin-antitoxin system RelE/ParE family toxin n=1 Tax=Geminocystis sp. GBBB08 TaxID=2604140 RepID=UPI0027E33DA7|nr:type II toxin-antitoxin system YafQ family toxin [Geminocystis sp. GBBB08]MBL1209944.1 type II toxin-antitoxin system mRNA interferase toxin, RelE/StbE family [Geminocystis sp. GBBB08]